eukprot:3067641-Prymnesium_polylepis.1
MPRQRASRTYARDARVRPCCLQPAPQRRTSETAVGQWAAGGGAHHLRRPAAPAARSLAVSVVLAAARDLGTEAQHILVKEGQREGHRAEEDCGRPQRAHVTTARHKPRRQGTSHAGRARWQLQTSTLV